MSSSPQQALGAPQGELAVATTKHEAAERLVAHIRRTLAPEAQVELSLTDNQCTMITVRREPGRYRLRLHHMFAEAGPDIVAALGRYVTRAERAASAADGSEP